MEDRFYTASIEVPGCTAREKVLLNAVLDGHGGHVSTEWGCLSVARFLQIMFWDVPPAEWPIL